MWPSAEGSYPHMPVAFDLDGTLAEGVWPEPHIGRAIPEGLTMLRHYAKQGHPIVVYTSRPASHKDAIWDWLRLHGLKDIVYDVVTDKPLAGLYVDDRAWRFERE